MPKQTLRKTEKQIKDSYEILKKLELRPCQGDSDLRQKALEIEELKSQISSLEKERDDYLYSRREEQENDQT